MKDEARTKRQLLSELSDLRQKMADLQRSEETFAQMKESHEKFLKAFLQNSIPIGLTTLEDGQFVEVSEAFLRLMGRKRDEVIGHTSIDIGFITEKQRKSFFDELNKRGRVENLDMEVSTKGGALRYGLFNAVMMSLGNEKYLLTVMTDITERKLAEAQLWENQERLRLALQAGKQGYHDLDVQNDHLYYSDQYLEILGYGRDELEPRVRSWKKLVHPQDKTAVFRILKEHFDGRTDHCEVTYRLKVKSGAWRWFRGHAEIVKRDDNDRPLRMMGTITDVTSYKELEQELEKRVEARTAELVEVNAALKVLLKQREQDKTDMEETMAANLKLMVLPYLHKLKTSNLNDQLKAWVSLIDESLDKVSSPYIKKLNSKYSVLTPKELQVAEHIRSGKTSKEIADMMNLSPRTVDVFRYSLRKKLGLNNKKRNLQALLSSL